jgi:putative membrane protein
MYFVLGYLAMVVAKVLLGVRGDLRGRWATFAVPVVGAFVMVAADLVQDPFLSTFAGRWVFPHGGGYFGVPLSNFLGWFVTGWIFLQIDALVLARRTRPLPPTGRAWWLQALVLWGLMALHQPLLLAAGPRLVAEDGGGRVWRSADLFETTTIVALFTMLFVAVTGCLLIAAPHDREGGRP